LLGARANAAGPAKAPVVRGTFEQTPPRDRLDQQSSTEQRPLHNRPNSSKPRPVPGINILKLPIGPEEAFVLSRVDGNTTEREIGYATSFPEDQVARCLSRLESLGAVEYDDRTSSHSGAIAILDSSAGTSRERPTETATGRFTSAESPAAPPYDATELDAPADLEANRKQEILELFYRLDALDHYQLLGITRSADRRAVKAAYYEKVKTFHPDRYFGKELGPFASKLERCFTRLTEAHDTLSAGSSRQEYDAYLAELSHAEELERALSQVVTFNDLDLLEQQLGSALEAQESAELKESTKPQNELLQASVTDSEPVIKFAEACPSSPVPRMSDEDRKRFLAHKLRVSGSSLRAPPPASSSATPPSPPPPLSRDAMAEQLRRQLGTSRRDGQLRQLETQLATADAAMAANDPVAASNALRIAQSLAPADPGIAERLAKTQELAAVTLSDTYLRQAEYEEKSGHIDAAARSYERAARGKPSPILWESAARCLLESGGDLRSAGDFARKSIALDPERAASHLLLGQVFLAARMRSSAVAELERARRLDPNNDTVANLLGRIGRDEI
jgi:curved DNA-binding protein CbpA